MEKYDLQDTLKRAMRTPSSFLGVTIDYIESRLDGEILPDPSHPLIQLVEATSAHTVQAINEGEVGDRRAYPLLSNSLDDLYGWMETPDHLALHSQPGQLRLKLYLERDAVIAAMTPIPNSRIKRLVIPRYTQFTVNNLYNFTLLYPIEIRLLPYGKTGMLQIVYNTDKKTPIQTIGDNVLPWNVMVDGSRRQLVEIPIDLLQLTRTTTNVTVVENAEIRHSEGIPKGESFHYVRVFHSKDRVNWSPIEVTYDEIARDIFKPTAVVRTLDGVVDLYIPGVYIRSNQIYSNIRMDIYSTRGDVTVPMTLMRDGDFTMTLSDDIDEPTLAPYASKLQSIPRTITSDDTLRGGADGMEFEKVREMIIYNGSSVSGDDDESKPITPTQLKTALNRRGFDIIQVVDDLTDRVYYATRTLRSYGADNYLSIKEEERPTIFNSAISSGMARMETSIDKLAKFPGIYDNGNRVTISPNTLFDYSSGQLYPLRLDEYPHILSKGIETQINIINANQFVYTPFYYVLNAGDSNFDLRAYYIDKPTIRSRRFDNENVTAEIEVSTLAFEVLRIPKGYRIILQSQVGETYEAIPVEDLSVQLAFHPDKDSAIAHIDGELLSVDNSGQDTYYYWGFDLETNYDFDSNDNIVITNGMIREPITRKLSVSLNTEFTVIYGASNHRPVQYQPSAIDNIMAKFLMGDDPIGILSEIIDVELGRSLDALAKPHRTLGGSREYLLYPENVMDYYTADVYEMDDNGRRKFKIVNGAVEYNIIHRKGEPKIDEAGNHRVLHYKGTVQYDENNDPIVVSERPTSRFVDIFVMDGIYYYANDDVSNNEKNYIPEQIVYQSLDQLEPIRTNRLERTQFFLYPKKTIGHIKVVVDDGRHILINSQLSFKVKVLLSETISTNPEYKAGMERLINEVINEELKERTVTTMNMITKIKSRSDENLIGLEIHMISNGEEFFTFTATDDSVRPNIHRVARLGEDGRITVREDVSFDAREHTISD